MSNDARHDHAELVGEPSSGRIFTARRRVRLGDSSVAGRLRLDAAARYLQDIANDDSRDAGSPSPTAWVARRTTLQVDSLPHYLDMVDLATWCSGLGSRWAERRYSIVADAADSTRPAAVQGATLWVHVDMATMKPIAVPAGFADQFGEAAHGRAISARQQLPIRPPVASDVRSVAWPVRVTDFDVLGHVNNAVYWAMVDEQIAGRGGLHTPFTVTVEHHGAIDPGDDVELRVLDSDAGFDMWVTTASGRLTAAVRVTSSTLREDSR